ncbi:hypothetical protein F5Y16DRAFT_79558 [Xylariaceae sp. FL0255]|nr:hypothetical protein F5Y16DRAFT_79558 [Xylariaceae sp. FL0255]
MNHLRHNHFHVSQEDAWIPNTNTQLDYTNDFNGKPTAAHIRRERPPFSWGRELTSLTVSVLVVSALVALLLYVRDKPYYETWDFVISLNSLLAILTTTYKTAQLHAVSGAIGQVKWMNFRKKPQRLRNFEIYDESSRGPQGAIKLVFTVKWGLATVGAVVTLLALTNDPFTQQVVQLVPRNVNTPDSSSCFGYALKYSTDPKQTAESNIQTPEISTRDQSMQGSIVKGIFNIQTPDEFSCGGACEWNGTYHSLGFSSTCENVTQATMNTMVCSSPDKGVTNVCNYTTPGGVTFSSQYVQTDSSTALRVAVNDSFFTALNDNVPISPDFLKVAIFRPVLDNYDFNDLEIVNNSITECSISLTMHEYSNITANGSTLTIGNETIVKLLPTDLAFVNGSFVQLPANSTIVFNRSENGLIDPPLQINEWDLSNMIIFFESNGFESHIIAGNAPDTSQVGIGAAFLNVNLTDTFTSLAKSMTDYVRSLSSGPNAQIATGSQIQSVVYVNVRWEWLALPVLQELIAVGFVLYVVLSNRSLGVPAWKTSALAVLLHFFDPTDNSIETSFLGPKAVQEKSKNTQAWLKH